MSIESIKLPVADLTMGMVVVKLDRPWLETPFKMQGFKIATPGEIRQLATYCQHVYVDIGRGVVPPIGKGQRVLLDEAGEIVNLSGVIGLTAPRARAVTDYALPPPAHDYAIASTFDDELPQARAAMAETKTAMQQLTARLAAAEPAELEVVKAAVSALEDSVLRNPDPALLLRALVAREPFSLRHCVNSAVLAITIARELGLRRQAIHELAMGVLLADIGKLRLPRELLRTTRRLTRRENEVMQQHVAHGVEMAKALGSLTPGTIAIIRTHHERFNGSGYPEGLVGGELPLATRVAGLADSFDALTSERAYAAAVPLHEATQELYAATVELFQRDLVERFLQALGTYPVGSVVALSDGSLALVLAQNRQRRLLPRVLCLTDGARQPLPQPVARDLMQGGGRPLTVREVVDPLAVGLPRPAVGLLPQ